MLRITKSLVVLGLTASFVSSLIVMFILFNLSFVTQTVYITEPNHVIAQLEVSLAGIGFVANLFLIRYILKEF